MQCGSLTGTGPGLTNRRFVWLACSHLNIHLGQSEEQQHALLVVSVTPCSTRLKLLEEKVQLFLIERLCQLGKHVEQIYPHCLKGIRLHHTKRLSQGVIGFSM